VTFAEEREQGRNSRRSDQREEELEDVTKKTAVDRVCRGGKLWKKQYSKMQGRNITPLDGKQEEEQE